MKRAIIIFITILFVLSGFSQDKELVKLLNEAGCSKDYPGSPYLVVFDKTFSKVMDSGLTHTTQKVFYKVLNDNGIRRLKSLTFSYDPLSAYIKVKKAFIVKGKTGDIIEIKKDKIKDYPAPARAIYWGAREKMVPIEGLSIGDGIYVEVYRKGFTYALLFSEDESKYIPPMKGHFYDIVHFYSSYPVKVKSYRVSLPITKKVQYEFYNGTSRHYAKIKGRRIEYFWEVKDIKPMKREPGMVSPSDVFPKLLISTSPDWKTKSLWFYRVNEDYGSFDYDDKIKRKVNEIIDGAKDDFEKISRLTHWVAEEIRYSGLSMGKGEGYTLHKGTITFRDRCGVCKDKAGMLITMLRAAGFEAYPAMTMAGSRIDDIPADQFNHCVTVVKYKGEYMLLDPTWVPGVRELWSSAEQQQQYLPGVPEGSDLKTTPISPPENHYLKFSIKTDINKNGSALTRIVITAEGQSDAMLRRFFTRTYVKEWDKNLKKELLRVFPDAKINNVFYRNPYDISKPMLIKAEIERSPVYKRGKKYIYIEPVSAKLPFEFTIGFMRFSPELKKRKYPFRTRCSQLIKVKEEIKLPFKFSFEGKPVFKEIKGSGADFNGTVFKNKNKILLKVRVALKKRIYSPDDWESFRGAIIEFRKIRNGFVLKGGKK